MAAKKERQVEAAISVKETGWPRSIFFNTFTIISLGAHRMISFGLHDGRGWLDTYGCVVTKDVLGNARASMIEFLARLGEITPLSLPQLRGSGGEEHLDCANYLSVSQASGIGEIRLATFSYGEMVERSIKRPGTPVALDATPLAMLHCDVGVLKLFVAELFGESELNKDADSNSL